MFANQNTNPYDNNNSSNSTPHHHQMMMMMMMNSSANTFQNSMNGTLSRQNHINGVSGGANGALNMSQYDPVEYRRIQYQTPAMLAHPPIQVDELFQHIERLKAQNNAKFSAEYESIEPGQQFTWEHSILDLNRQKNRYANVIAYDHSRVVLSKLPAHVFAQNQTNTTTSTANNR